MRLRSMVLDAKRSILVLDRYARPVTPDVAERFAFMAKQVGAAGGLLFDESVELGGDEAGDEALVVHPDELGALRWAVRTLNDLPIGASADEVHPTEVEYLDALRLLVQRVAERRPT